MHCYPVTNVEGAMYAKIFSSLWEGTLYGQSDAQLVFIFLLARCDAEGFVNVTLPAIAGPTGMDVERVRAAVELLEAPDANSRTQDQGGCRLERIDADRDWGWQIVNYVKYREMRDEDTIRTQTRERVRRHRERKRTETLGNAPLRHVEVEVEVEGLESKDLASGEAERVVSGPRLIERTEPEGFSEWYEAYPRKVKRPVAARAYRAALRREGAERWIRMMDCTRQWIEFWKEQGTEESYIPHPASFLNGRQYADLPPEGRTDGESG